MKKASLRLSQTDEIAAGRLVGAQTPEEIASILEVPLGQLLHILYAYPPSKKYVNFEIPKKNGETRKISAAIGGLKILQKKLMPLLVFHYKKKESVHGFVKSRGILTNAKVHKNRKYVLNVDLQNFYGSINYGRILGLFKSKPFKMSEKAAAVVAQICVFENGLPQGACTSPVLSNYIASELDRKLGALSTRNRFRYTRYADDISFSTNKKNFPKDVAYFDGNNPITSDCFAGRSLVSIVEKCGFKINPSKTRLQIKGVRQDVTGLTVNEFPNVRRNYIRDIRGFIHAWRKYGEDAVERTYREKYAKNKSRLLNENVYYFKEAIYGRLAFLYMVRGEDEVYMKLISQAADLDSEPTQKLLNIKDKYKMYDVFISHASEDKELIARPIFEACKKNGIHAFLDEEEISWGDSLTQVLNSALGKSKLFLAVLSDNSIDKKWPMREINTSLARQIEGKQKFLPLVVGSVNMDGLGLTSDLLHLKWDSNADDVAIRLKDSLTRLSR